jgi:hypothetical protein
MLAVHGSSASIKSNQQRDLIGSFFSLEDWRLRGRGIDQNEFLPGAYGGGTAPYDPPT